MPPHVRMEYFLVFTNNPPAADVVREDSIVNKDPDGMCSFRWIPNPKKDPVGEQVIGKIVRQGMQKDMKVLKLDEKGAVLPRGTPGLGTRKQEVERARLRSVHAQAHNLQDVAQGLLNAGPDGLCDKNLAPVLRVKRLPRKRSKQAIKRVQNQLDNLPCFKATSGKIELWTDSGVYCSVGFLTTARFRYGLRPCALFRTILKHLFPVKYRLLDGVGVSGKRYCARVPEKLVDSIVLYCQEIYRRKGGIVDNIELDAPTVLKNLISNTRKRHGMAINLLENLHISEEAETEPSTVMDTPRWINPAPTSMETDIRVAPSPTSMEMDIRVAPGHGFQMQTEGHTPLTPSPVVSEHGYSAPGAEIISMLNYGPSPPLAVHVPMGDSEAIFMDTSESVGREIEVGFDKM